MPVCYFSTLDSHILFKRNHQILLKLAQDARRLLDNPHLQINSQILRDRYYNSLLKQGFAYYNNRVRHTKLLKAFQEFFPIDVFEQVGRTSLKTNWLSSLVENSQTDICYHPIRHLLLMTFLGFSAQDFLTSFVEFKPFGNPPYPCLNPAAQHYQELIIESCQIFDNLTKGAKFKRPIAIFTCDCGFIYQRLGPDNSENDKYRFSSIRQYGEVWETKLKELWIDLSLSSSEIGRRLGTSQTSIGRHAIRLNLPVNSQNTRSLQGYKRHRNPRITFSQRLQTSREQWLKTLELHPNLTRQELMDTENFLYLWLRRNDSEWFEQHLPKVAQVKKMGRYVDWQKIDVELSEKVFNCCQEIRNSKGFPVWISVTKIIDTVGHKDWIDKRQRRLPLTAKILADNLETFEEYMIRKIDWTKQYYLQANKAPSILQFKIKAVLRNKTAQNSPNIQKHIQQAVEEIRKLY